MYCYKCGNKIDTANKIMRQQQCPFCGASLHCCLNCKFYDEKSYHQCRETEAEFVSDKKSANFCDYFLPGTVRISVNTDKAEQARKKLEVKSKFLCKILP